MRPNASEVQKEGDRDSQMNGRIRADVLERRDAIAHLVADLKRQMPADVILSREMIVECPLSDASAVNDIVD